jgi:hypothetical protein
MRLLWVLGVWEAGGPVGETKVGLQVPTGGEGGVA